MAEFGLMITTDEDMTRIQATCPHQSGLIYVIPADRSWVCSKEQLASHALAGFFKDLTSLADPKIHELMQSWGIYFRQLPIDAEQDKDI
jgi:hypothetical protein